MTEQQLLGPWAHGGPCASAVLKESAEDFQVDEVLDIPLAGEGEHLWLWVEKRNLNTEDAARQIARAARLPLRAVGYAGLKDRLALTRQWFSLHLPGKADPDFSAMQSDSLRILEQTRHLRKLQRGAHSANGFRLRLRHLQADPRVLEERLQRIRQCGVPNYFGMQRFGFSGSNLSRANEFAQAGVLPEQRNLRSRVLSAARSYLFNRVLASRVADGSWSRAMLGDLLVFTDSRSFFPATEAECRDPRLEALDLHPSGPLWGAGPSPAGGPVQALEEALAGQQQALVDWLSEAGMKHERRILRLPIRDLSWHYPEPEVLQLEFVLPTGCFATAVVRELVSLAGPTDI
ncbi:tRNA pseudouridine(13) synthase TruD [Stutzerimonas kirkiae]|uniref:tRNA pseudouridine synthase D n=1 Tax=Stutzerimonas kirkiae TaxID=2211392 RepID=A0A4Q9RE33_9GAMM|nr:tRNA pseudouridine(13) synthase TruD [Stutzerimonas kirkiae]TBU99986.1 tRNA pseudouridine(13) synthase TruD [Stutzerimonas kirkiae]TBV05692.1 tRNA pseudouridine(13) synthase TruD [Stutzerimonas kirkiae]TBV10565.1 tRNA pseudouridine(13) synthase TruD [Stutzerimonas kirkiae]TBV17423.1 tRNA pseudouridine(13) synthase TruD [Stutzerimonas kirkiae]